MTEEFTEHTMHADIPGGLTLVLRWRDLGGALSLLERTWEPTQPDILPQSVLAELVDGLAAELAVYGWPEDATSHTARGFLGLKETQP